MATRDISQAQFMAAIKSHGMSFEGFMGYVRIPHPSGNGATNVSHLNAGSNRRAKLAYLLAAKDRYLQQQ
jgi:hypothetical protein